MQISRATSARRARLDAVGFVWDEQTEQERYLADLIRRRVAPFSSGVVGGPFRKLCDLLAKEWGVRVPQAALLQAFKEAGWVDCGRLGSADLPTKRHIFAAPDVARGHTKSDLRRMVENIDTT